MSDAAKVIKPSGAHRDRALTRQARQLGFPDVSIKASEIYFLRGEADAASLQQMVTRLIDDAPGGVARIDDGKGNAEPRSLVIEVARRAGVTDRVAAQLTASAAQMGARIDAATGSRFEITSASGLEEKDLNFIVHNLLCNPVIETWSFGAVQPGFPVSEDREAAVVETIPLRGLDADALARVNADRSLALDPEEM